MSNLVILNLADPGQMGPVTKVKSGLEAKQRTRATVSIDDAVVPIYDLFDELKEAGNLRASSDLIDIAVACEKADKIYLCTHGLANDTENAYANASGGQALATWRDFVRLLDKLLTSSSKRYNIALVMCYGARSETYRAAELDHTGQVPIGMLRTSFAYKLFKSLCERNRSIRLTARTGAVAFDAKTGVSTVEQEAAIDIALDKEEFLREPKTQQTIDEWKRFKDEGEAAGRAHEAAGKEGVPSQYKAWNKARTKFLNNPEASAGLFASGVEKAGKAYYQIIAKKNAMEQRKSKYQDLAKYGKLVYSNMGGGIFIVSKYGNQKDIGPGTVLYAGPMV